MNPWWKVNLRRPSSISQVFVYNRSDCCPDRILNFELIVRYEDTVVYSSKTRAPDESSTAKGIYTFNITDVTQATEVEISLSGEDRILSIAEVQVFGTEQKV